MSLEALAKGISTKCAETTPVILEGTLHKLQTKPQNSLPLTSRPLIEGGPSRCKQEVVESVVTAGCANGMVEMAESTEIADVNGMALLGRELAERARGISKGNETEHKPQLRLQELKLLCREIVQHSGIGNENIPIAHGVPLKGE